MGVSHYGLSFGDPNEICVTPRNPEDPLEERMLKFYQMKYIFQILDKMRCLRKRSTVSFLGVLVVFLLFMNLYIEDSYVLEGDKQLIRETSTHQLNSERYVHTFKDLSNFSEP